MSRLQKKCFIGATSMHCLLLLALIVGPGFFTKESEPSAPMIEIITAEATDAINPNPGTRGAATPAPAPVTPAPVAPTPPPVQSQPAPVVKPVEPVQPKTVELQKDTRKTPEAVEVVKPKPKTPEVKISDKVVRLNDRRQPNPNPEAAAARAEAEAKANAKAAAERAKLFAEASRRIGSGLSSSTEIKFDGPPGDGGAGLANYGQIVRRRYTDAWVVPSDLTDDEATVKVSVTIARDGRVISSHIIDSTGSRLAASSIQRTLDRVTSIGVAFPEGAKENQRTFTMTFNLKAKKSFG
jgi:outer membrane biosynthesis protein TonB